MNSDTRYVFDTNVLISALLFNTSAPGQAFTRSLDDVQACRDPKDDRILELAVNGNASFVVTGDDDLLVLNPFRGIQIVTPAKLLELLDESSLEGRS